MIRRLNPIIRGWAAYYRTEVSSRTFEALDQYLWQLTYKWALISHRNKSRPWVFARYFGMFNRSRQDRWVFGDRASGAYLHRFAWTGIVRHQIVPGTASPDDPALTDYSTKRRRKAPLPINRTSLRLYQALPRSRKTSCGAASRSSPASATHASAATRPGYAQLARPSGSRPSRSAPRAASTTTGTADRA